MEMKSVIKMDLKQTKKILNTKRLTIWNLNLTLNICKWIKVVYICNSMLLLWFQYKSTIQIYIIEL